MANNLSGSLDTNTVLRLTLGDIPDQAYTVKNLLERSSQLEVADAVVLEMVFAMEKVYKLSREVVASNVFTIIRHPKINCNRRLFELTIPIYVKYPRLSIVDCALTQYAILNESTPLYTFDKELAEKCPEVTVIPK